MRIGLLPAAVTPFATPELLVETARVAEECGFHSLWLPEHVVLFDQYSSVYPYSEDGRLPAPAEAGILEPFTTLAFLAGATKSIRLATGICLVPQRNPVYTAKQVTAVDWLTGGRFDFGVGVGWLAEEFAAVGTPFERRGARCRSYLEVMKRLWCDEVSVFADEFYTLPACRQYPKPVQTPHPPIHFGGESDAALARVADLGQGWYGFGLAPDRARERISKLGALLGDRGRTREGVLVSVSPGRGQGDVATPAAYAECGADQVILPTVTLAVADVRPKLERLAEKWIVRARAG